VAINGIALDDLPTTKNVREMEDMQ